MKSLKDSIRNILKRHLNVTYRIKVKEPTKETMNKKLFTETLNQLREIEDRTDFLAEEIGMDMSAYEEQFFTVIENLLKLCFSKPQLALIQMYLYQLVPDKEWDGTITVEIEKEEKVVPFKSPNDVWEVINKIK